MNVKTLIQAILSRSLLDDYREVRVSKLQAHRERAAVQATFSDIYKNGAWGKSSDPKLPYFSGRGSHDESIVSVYVQQVTKFLGSLDSKPDVLDLGCGDFAVGSRIRPMCSGYIACDVVPELIAFNRKKYKSAGVDFRVLDLVSDAIPKADIIFIRQVLQHLSNQQIAKLVPKLKSGFSYLVVTEHVPIPRDFTPNLDMPAGPGYRLPVGSGVVLTKPPFNLVVKDEYDLCEVEVEGGVVRTTVYVLN